MEEMEQQGQKILSQHQPAQPELMPGLQPIQAGSGCLPSAVTQGNRIEEDLDAILSSHEGKPTELIPLLQQVQQLFGYLPAPAMRKLAKFTRLPESRVFAVASFYAQFRFTPTGKNIVKICQGTACHVLGAPRILDEVQKQLGIKAGETTPDLEYSVETVACIGCCALAPCIMVNQEVHGRLSSKDVASIFGKRGTEGENNDVN